MLSSYPHIGIAHQHTFDNALGGQEHHHGECRREDEVLTGVEQGKRCRNLDRGVLIVLERLVEFNDLVAFVIEMLQKCSIVSAATVFGAGSKATDLNSLVIDKGINSHSRSLVICGICLLAEFRSTMIKRIRHLTRNLAEQWSLTARP
jgi:hypothetical protein